MEGMKTLHEIGRECGTDKARGAHVWRGQSYMDIYDKYFAPMREEAIGIIEIGVKQGKSLRAWSAYFPNAHIVGIDINPNSAQHADSDNRISVVIGDQTDPATIDDALQKLPCAPSIVLDDGSHLNELTMRSYAALWPCVAQGGYYILEDMATSYVRDIVADMERGHWRADYVKDGTQNDRGVINRWLLETIARLDRKEGDVRAIHVHCMTVIVEKVGHDLSQEGAG